METRPFELNSPTSSVTSLNTETEHRELLERLESLEQELQLTKERLNENDSRFDSLFHRWREKGDPEVDIIKSQSSGSKEKEKSSSDPKTSGKPDEKKEKKEKQWYEKLGLRGYAQFRYNETLSESGAPAQMIGDRSVGDGQEFFIRRARLIIFGDVSEHLGVYLQPDFASSVPNSTDATYFAQIRDWYGDVYLTKDKVHRLRVGNSKIPYGWENMQSSSNRLPLDRADALNTAQRNERDLGLFYYWTPEFAQDFFKEVLDEGLKGSGNYGLFGFGAYNGQGGSIVEQNENLHIVSRLTVPMRLRCDQLFEMSIQGYTGRYAVASSAIRPLGIGAAARPVGAIDTGNTNGHLDQRMALSSVWYPKPFGIQCEWNVGKSPVLNEAQTEIVVGNLHGGYVMAMYKWDTKEHGTFFPFLRYNTYEGGAKAERNAPFVEIDEFDVGLEWQVNKSVEWVNVITWTDRTNTTAQSSGRSYAQFEGELLRTQVQINY